jgi:hypothetical protein
MFRIKFPTGAKLISGNKLTFRFKRFIFDKSRPMEQGIFDESIGDLPDVVEIVSEKSVENDFVLKKSKASKRVMENQKGLLLNDVDQSVSMIRNDINSNNDSSMILGENRVIQRCGQIESVKSESTERIAIVSGLFRMEESVRDFVNTLVRLDGDEYPVLGVVIGPFGKLGKCKVSLYDGMQVAIHSKVVVW